MRLPLLRQTWCVKYINALFLDGQQRLIGVLALDIAASQITRISSIVHPYKLTTLGHSPISDRY